MSKQDENPSEAEKNDLAHSESDKTTSNHESDDATIGFDSPRGPSRLESAGESESSDATMAGAHDVSKDGTMDFEIHHVDSETQNNDATTNFGAQQVSGATRSDDGTADFGVHQQDDGTVDFDASKIVDRPKGQDVSNHDEPTNFFEDGVPQTAFTRDEIVARQKQKRQKTVSAIGTTIGEYEIVSELGRGGMGVVYKARHRKLQRDVALKMILTGDHAGRDALDRFMIEARAVAHLQHPNIVQIFDIGESKGLPFFSLEFVDGQPLDEVVAEEPLSSRGAAKIVCTLAEAMQYAHDEGILHRDIKPANILMSKDGTPKLTDFGLAKVVDSDSSKTRAGQIMGTPSYMSPEQAKGQHDHLGAASDQYSLGALLYRLISGRAPFAASDHFETMKQVISNDPVPPRQLQPGISVDLETICLKSLQKDPAARYENCTEFARDLLRFIKGEPIAARPVSGMERFWRWCKRNPRVAIPSAAAVALMIIATGVSTWSYIAVSQKNIVIQNEKDYAVAQETIAKEQTKIAKEQTKIAKEQTEIAEEQTEIAEKKTRVALEQAEIVLEVIQDTLTNVNMRLSSDPKLDVLRIDISKSLSKSMERIDPSVLADEQSEAIPTLMAIRNEMISVFEKEGQYEEAMADCKKVYELAEERIKVKAGNDASRINLARIGMTYAGLIDKVERDAKRSEAMLNRSLELVRDVIENPKPADDVDTMKDWEIRYTLGAILQNIGANVYAQGNLERFNECFTEAADVYENWQKRVVDDKDFAALTDETKNRYLADVERNLNRMRMGLATYQLKAGQYEDAFENYDNALAQAKKKFESESKSPMDRVTFQQMLDMYGFNKLMIGIAQASQHPEYLSDAGELFEQALNEAKSLVADYPKSTDLKYYLSLAHYRYGILKEFLKETEEARSNFKACKEIRVALQNDAPSEKHSNMLMVAEARDGNWEVAKQMADEKAKTQPDGAQWIRIARGYVLSSLCQDAPKKELRELALDAVRNAIESGYNDYFELQHEPDLLTLQDDEAFQQAIKKIKK